MMCCPHICMKSCLFQCFSFIRIVKHFACILSFSVAGIQNANAVPVDNLYRISVAVENQTEQARSLAVIEAYQALIVRLSGSEKALFNELIQRGQASAETLITSLRYRELEQQLILQLEFAEDPITQLLVNAGESIWGNDRPLLKPWVIVSNDNQFEVLGHQVADIEDLGLLSVASDTMTTETEATKITAIIEGEVSDSERSVNDVLATEQAEIPVKRTESVAFMEAMQAYGLPFVFPTDDELVNYDIQGNNIFSSLLSNDTHSVSAEGSNPGNNQSLRVGSPLSEALLVGYIEQIDDTRVIRLSLEHDGLILPINFVDQSGDIDVIARRVVIQVTSALSAKQAISYAQPLDGGLRQVFLEVNNIDTFQDYIGVMEYLSNHLAVKSFALNKVEGNQVQVELNLTTTWSEAQRVFTRDQQMAATTQPSRFTWLGSE